jgi:hypothetical protein
MNKQTNNVGIKRVCTMFEELNLEAFLIYFPTSAHNLDCSPNVSVREKIERGERRADTGRGLCRVIT